MLGRGGNVKNFVIDYFGPLLPFFNTYKMLIISLKLNKLHE